MRFLGCKFTQNALAAGALPRTLLGELKCSPDPLPISGAASRQGKGKERERGRREKGKWVLGREKREGREGKRGRSVRGRRRERVRGSLRHWR